MMNLGFLKILLWALGAIAVLGSTFKILKEYERAVVFRLGKFLSTKGPGVVFLIPLVDRVKKVDLRIVSIDVPRQDIMTMDNVPVTVDAVVYFHIIDPGKAVITIQDIYQSTFLLAQATLRNVLGQVELDDLLSKQTMINMQLQKIISVHTKQWGINISIVEIKEVTLPEQMKRAMAKQAETERERRARLIDAQGEYQASKTLAEAGEILSANPQGLQLRYLQTLRDISTNKGSTVLFPLPIDMLSPFLDSMKKLFQRKEESMPADMEKLRPAEKDNILINKETEGGKREKSEQIKTRPDLYEEPKPDLKERPKPEFQEKMKPPAVGSSYEEIIEKYREDMNAGKLHKEIITKYQEELNAGRLQPQYIQWVITDRCQSKCSHCEIIATNNDLHGLTIPQSRKAIDELVKLGCQYILITGGEPLIHKDIFDIVQYAKECGLSLGLTTNGYDTEENLIALADAKFDSVVITLDGYGNTLNRIRNSPDAYERGIRTIEFFRDINTPRINVSSILLDENLKEFPRLTEDIFRVGANVLQVQPQIFSNGKPKRNPEELIKDAFRFILEARRRGFPVEAGEQFGYLGLIEPMIRSTPFFCGCGWNTFSISYEGKVQGCPAISKANINDGDCRLEPLQKIWENGFAEFRKEIPEGLQEGCYRCPHLSACRGGCWLFRVQGLNPCFLLEAEGIYREITNEATLFNQTS